VDPKGGRRTRGLEEGGEVQTVVTRIRIRLIAVGAAGALAAFVLGVAADARAAAGVAAPSTIEVSERFTPDRLGAPTNLSLSARLSVPEAVRRLTVFTPAGLRIDARGASTCRKATLEQHGPEGCPATSRAGFGGGVGLLALPREAVRERFTLDFFFASLEPRHIALLVYASGFSPVVVERLAIAREVDAPPPYGLGFSVELPPVATIPGARPATIESVFATLGAANVVYPERVHGRRRLVRVRGLLVPRSCPAGGFKARASLDLLGGQSMTLEPTVPCPAR
jgi:hypothetical protein